MYLQHSQGDGTKLKPALSGGSWWPEKEVLPLELLRLLAWGQEQNQCASPYPNFRFPCWS